jgi:predicted SAM-dependent methyltransferase
VHIASGPLPLPGWINVDASPQADLRLDLRRRLPYASASVAFIFTEHFVDHLQFPDSVSTFLRECQRVLKPGGAMRVVVHDGERLLRKYIEKDADFFTRLGECALIDSTTNTLMEVVNNVFRFNGAHQFIYDFETLEAQLLAAGFSSVQRSSYRGSSFSDLNVDSDLPDRAVQSLYVDAIK